MENPRERKPVSSHSDEGITNEKEENGEELQEDDGQDEDFEEEAGTKTYESPEQKKAKIEKVMTRLSTEKVGIRVHDVLIKGNFKTKDSLIEAELEPLRNATTVQDLIQASSIVNARLRNLDIFDSVLITLDNGPRELPGTANVVVQVQETENPLTGSIGFFSKPQARSWTVEGSLKLKNKFGYGDILDSSGSYGWDQSTEVSTGISLPRFGILSTPLTARISLLSQDWLKFSSYKEQFLGLSVGLYSNRYHDLSYNLAWRNLTDPSRTSSKSIRRHLGHSLLSSVKYMYELDRRDSKLRPTCGYAFASVSHVGGLDPDSRSLRFVRQEFDLRCAFPLGFLGAAFNFGISGGIILPLGKGFMKLPSPLTERFFIGGNTSPVCTLSGPTSLLGFKCRGLGPTDARRVHVSKHNQEVRSDERDVLGGDLAVTAFADLSFDLPMKLFKDSGIHGHFFASAGNLAKLTENEFKSFSLKNFGETFRSSVGGGIIIPTKILRVEINYCYILRQFAHDNGKTGIQFNFSASS